MMNRQPTYAGSVEEKDNLDIMYWAAEKSAHDRLRESWRLHCLNHNISVDTPLNKLICSAKKRNDV